MFDPYNVEHLINPLYTGTPYTGTLATVKTWMKCSIMHILSGSALFAKIKIKQASGTEIRYNLENSTCDPLKVSIFKTLRDLNDSDKRNKMLKISI